MPVDVPVPIGDEQARAIQRLGEFGITVVSAGEHLAGYMGRVLGTIPEDTAGLVVGDPLRFVRTVIAAQYDRLLNKILGSKPTQPVTPSLAIPLLRAAYDEARPELQELWAHLIANAMDPARAGDIRLEFIETLQRLHPIDALILQHLYQIPGDRQPNTRDFYVSHTKRPLRQVQIALENLERNRCLFRASNPANFVITPYGYELVAACSS